VDVGELVKAADSRVRELELRDFARRCERQLEAVTAESPVFVGIGTLHDRRSAEAGAEAGVPYRRGPEQVPVRFTERERSDLGWLAKAHG
jgi:hypothetical protein